MMTRKVAFITNATEYAGAPAATAYAKSDWEVFCHDDSFTSEHARLTFERENPGQTASDASNTTSFIATGLELFGRIDALISNDIPKDANNGGTHINSADMLENDDLFNKFEQYVDSLLIEPVRILRLALPSMKAARSGSIVFVTSGAPLRSPPMTIAHGYSGARAGVNWLTKSLAAELAPFNIQVNAVAPFMVYSQTMFPSSIGAEDPSYAPLVQQLVPMQRFGAPEELGALILRLTSGEMQFVSGQIIAFSGAAC